MKASFLSSAQLRFQTVVNLIGNAAFKCFFKAFAFSCFLQTGNIGTDIGPSAVHASRCVESDCSFGGTDNTYQLAFGFHFIAAGAFA